MDSPHSKPSSTGAQLPRPHHAETARDQLVSGSLVCFLGGTSNSLWQWCSAYNCDPMRCLHQIKHLIPFYCFLLHFHSVSTRSVSLAEHENWWLINDELKSVVHHAASKMKFVVRVKVLSTNRARQPTWNSSSQKSASIFDCHDSRVCFNGVESKLFSLIYSHRNFEIPLLEWFHLLAKNSRKI